MKDLKMRGLDQALYFALAACLTLVPIPASAAHYGTVAGRIDGCDYFLVDTSSGYTLAEWYSGHDPNINDRMGGALNEYGFHDLYDITADETLHVYIEDYDLDKDDAFEQLHKNCDD